jgi:hypothetical protein
MISACETRSAGGYSTADGRDGNQPAGLPPAILAEIRRQSFHQNNFVWTLTFLDLKMDLPVSFAQYPVEKAPIFFANCPRNEKRKTLEKKNPFPSRSTPDKAVKKSLSTLKKASKITATGDNICKTSLWKYLKRNGNKKR